MLAKRIALVVCLLVGTSLSLWAQVRLIAHDTTRAFVGNQLGIAMRLESMMNTGGPDTMSCDLYLSNPTVFYPQAILIDSVSDRTRGVQATLRRENDSVYHIRIVLPSHDSSLSFSLLGEALAGNDSLCVLSMRNTAFASTTIAETQARVLTTSYGVPLPYIRFATLNEAYPDPCEGCAVIRWRFRVDKATDLTFNFYDLQGRLLRTLHRSAEAGPGTIELSTDFTFDAGMYQLQMISNSGQAWQKFIIVN